MRDGMKSEKRECAAQTSVCRKRPSNRKIKNQANEKAEFTIIGQVDFTRFNNANDGVLLLVGYTKKSKSRNK